MREIVRISLNLVDWANMLSPIKARGLKFQQSCKELIWFIESIQVQDKNPDIYLSLLANEHCWAYVASNLNPDEDFWETRKLIIYERD